MSDRRRSKLEVCVAAACLAVVLAGLLIVTAPPADAVVSLEHLVLCHLQERTGEYSQIVSRAANGHLSHKEDLILPLTSVCPDKVASPSR